MTAEQKLELTNIRNRLIEIRNDCFNGNWLSGPTGEEFEAASLVGLSRSIRALYYAIEAIKYSQTTKGDNRMMIDKLTKAERHLVLTELICYALQHQVTESFTGRGPRWETWGTLITHLYKEREKITTDRPECEK